MIKNIENVIEKVYKDEANGKEALTKYEVLDYDEKYNLSLVKANILTGRTHQIRVHFNEIDHPILGDGKYNRKKAFIDNLIKEEKYLKYIIIEFHIVNPTIDVVNNYLSNTVIKQKNKLQEEEQRVINGLVKIMEIYIVYLILE